MSALYRTYVQPDPGKIGSFLSTLPLHTIFAWSHPCHVRVCALDRLECEMIEDKAAEAVVRPAQGDAGEWSETDIIRLETDESDKLVKCFEEWRKENGNKKREA